MTRRGLVTGAALAALWATPGVAATWHVAPGGDDAAVGDAREPFATLQRAVDGLQQGDTVQVEPGVYRQAVRLDELHGAAERPIIIRARIPGSVFLLGSRTPTPWTPAASASHVYWAPLTEAATLVYERDTNREYTERADLYGVADETASFMTDATSGRLYVHTSDGAPPDRHLIEACVLPMAFDLYSGGPANAEILLRSHIAIEGFVMQGYAQAAVHIMRGNACEVRDCVVDHCGAGIFLHSCVRSAIRRCEVSWCFERHDNEGGGIAFRGRDYDNVVEDCVVHDCVKNGIRHYGRGFTGCAIRRCLVYRCGRASIQTKGKLDPDRTYAGLYDPPVSDRPPRIEHNVVVEPIHAHSTLFDAWGLRHNTVGALTGLSYRRGLGELPDTQLAFDPAEIAKQGFADASQRDYRLQADSPHRAKDAGAFHWSEAEVFFVKTDGDDAASGDSITAAWADPGHALARLRTGQTLYVLPGRYRLATAIILNGAVGLSVRGHGQGPAVFDGGGDADHAIAAEGRGTLDLRHLRFTGYRAAAVRAGANVTVTADRCVFDGNGAGLQVGATARVTKSVFVSNGQALRTAEDAPAANAESTPPRVYGCIVWSNTTAFAITPAAPWLSEFNLLGGGRVTPHAATLTAWREASGQDTGSLAAEPRFRDRPGGDFRLRPDSPGWGRGYLWSPVGIEDPPRPASDQPASPKFADARCTLATPTQANLSWRTTGGRTTVLLRYGKAGGPLDRVLVRDAGAHYGAGHAVTLFDLQPATRYEYQLGAAPFRHDLAETPRDEREWIWDTAVHRFETPSVFEPRRRTFHVDATRGDDAADGLTSATALASLPAASRRVEPGDRVVVDEGTYHGLLCPLNSGLPDAPIVFEAREGARVVLSGKQLLEPCGALLLDKGHIVLRGFVFEEHAKMLPDDVGLAGQVLIAHSRDIRVERCLFDGRMYYMTAARVAYSENIRFTDNVFFILSNYTGVTLEDNAGEVMFEHNTFYTAGTLMGATYRNARVVFRSNLFGEKSRVKWGQPKFNLRDDRELVFDRNYYAFDDANTNRFALRRRCVRGEPYAASARLDPDGNDGVVRHPLERAREWGLERDGTVGPLPWAHGEDLERQSETVRGVAPRDQTFRPLRFEDFATRPDGPWRRAGEGCDPPGVRGLDQRPGGSGEPAAVGG